MNCFTGSENEKKNGDAHKQETDRERQPGKQTDIRDKQHCKFPHRGTNKGLSNLIFTRKQTEGGQCGDRQTVRNRQTDR